MKYPFRTKALTSVAALSLALTLAGCSSSQTTNENTTRSESAAALQTNTSTSDNSTVAAGEISEDTHFDEDDLAWDVSEETTVELSDDGSSVSGSDAAKVVIAGGSVNISGAGTYRLSGSLSDGKISVTAGTEDVVRIIVDNASITSSTGSGIQIDEANEVLLYLEDGTSNSVTDPGTYADTGTDAANAAIYSMADLSIAGEGQLTVQGNYQDGITSKDGLVLVSGSVIVSAADDGIKGKDYVAMLGGNYAVTASGDGIKSSNDTDADRGWLHQYAGQLEVAAGDDGIKAEQILTLSGGTAVVSESTEGLEAPTINLSGGTVNVTASDDGINATAGSTTATQAGAGGPGGGGMDAEQDAHLNISAGVITINSEGDGLDSNGDVTISGGTTIVNGPTNGGNGALDSNGEISIDGGILVAAGSDGMAEGIGDGSAQSGLQVSLGSTVAAGTPIHIVDAESKVVASFVTAKDTGNLVYSSQDIVKGDSYIIYTGGSSDVEAGLGEGSTAGATEVSTVTAGVYTSGMGTPGGAGGGPGGW